MIFSNPASISTNLGLPLICNLWLLNIYSIEIYGTCYHFVRDILSNTTLSGHRLMRSSYTSNWRTQTFLFQPRETIFLFQPRETIFLFQQISMMLYRCGFFGSFIKPLIDMAEGQPFQKHHFYNL